MNNLKQFNQTKNFSLLFIKPEIFKRKTEVIQSLKERGYNIVFEKEFNNWRETAKKIYPEFTPNQINAYLKGYDKYNLNDKFAVLGIANGSKNIIKKLKTETGNFISYQNKCENTLRGEFGLIKDYNRSCDGITFVYCGFHCPSNKKELDNNIGVLRLK